MSPRRLPRAAWPTLSVLLGALLLAGCAGSRGAAVPELPSAFPGHSRAQILALLAPAADSLDAFTAKASLAVNTPERRGSFTAALRHRRGDSLYLSLSPGLGIEAARALVTPDSFFVYNRIEKTLQYGSNAFVQQVLPVPLGGDDVFRNLLGYLQPDPGVAWQVSAGPETYRLISPDSTETYTVDPLLWRVTRYERRAPDGTVLEDRTFSEFEPAEGGVLLPRRVLFRRPQDRALAALTYREYNLDPGALTFDLDVRGDARRVLIDGTR